MRVEHVWFAGDRFDGNVPGSLVNCVSELLWYVDALDGCLASKQAVA